MKKTIIIAAVVGICGLAQATTINAPSTLVGASALDGNNAYSWGIAVAVPTGETITSAEIDFTGVQLTVANSSGTGYLYTDLLNSKTTGVTTASDGDAAGDYWATKYSGANITSLGTKVFAAVGTTLTWSYVLSAAQLTALNSYLAAGAFNIGIDPDCHYSVGGLSFTYTLGSSKSNSVPDDAVTALLVVLSLAGLEIFRRQFAVAKIKA
jgi:hypothetical protein